ncbi:MAG: LamG domain-containing protein [Chiayiivirga sp.]|jgi:hypothetical protein|uniref:LamG-like jellyroll fold domain-containing protein n=1 Tax=Chiayiivirga sp. TaxID=2041042 RepID=UPI0025B88E4F|nr:LamG-like jellyroll fold domain-containing protein [Chiayiivirga sp.]MCI1728292.1 LamG domain-containing protein [Chiayiivirga sp.]
MPVAHRKSLVAKILLGLCLCHPAAALVVDPPLPVADYDFTGWLGDAAGNGATLTKVGAAALAYVPVTADGVDRLALAVPAGAGLRLALGPLLPQQEYSVAMIVSMSGTSSYAKLLDTNDLAEDVGLYALGNDLNYYTGGSASNDAFPADTLLQVVVTRAPDGTYVGYLDGVQQFTFVDTEASGQFTAIAAARTLHFLRDDNDTGNSEEAAGVLHRVRLFDRVLTPAEVTALESNRRPESIFRGGGFEELP